MEKKSQKRKNSKFYIESGLFEILHKYSQVDNKSPINLLCVFIGTVFFGIIGVIYLFFGIKQAALINLLSSLSNIFGVLIGFAISSFGILASCGNLDFIKAIGIHKINSHNKISTLKKIMLIFSHFLFSLIITFSYILFLYIVFLFTEDLNFSINILIKQIGFIILFTMLGLLISHSLIQTKALISNLYGLTLTQANKEICDDIKKLVAACKSLIKRGNIEKAESVLKQLKNLADDDFPNILELEKEIESKKLP